MSSIILQDGALVVRTPYAPGLVQALKAAIPGADRKWDAPGKAWIVTPEHGTLVRNLIEEHLHEQVEVPALAQAKPMVQTQLLEVRYLGRAKQRPDGTETAFGWVNGGWNAIFPKSVLMTWFGQVDRPGEAATLYQKLNVLPDSDMAEIKAAWKRLARQWHPDVCREPDAATQFQAIKDAWDILSDANQRARYDAGRALEATLRSSANYDANDPIMQLAAGAEWAPPLRCGYVMCRAVEKLGRFVISEILMWEDIKRSDGSVLVSSWPMDATMFVEKWTL